MLEEALLGSAPGSCKGDKRRDNIFVILIGESPSDIILQIIIL